MKTSRKVSLIVIALALLACVVVFIVRRSRPNKPISASASNTFSGASFEVTVVKPFVSRPLGGLLGLLGFDDGSELRFDNTSSGAAIAQVAPDRLELSAEGGWDLFIEIDGEGRITPATRLVFPIELGERQVKLRCRPANPSTGHLKTTTHAGSNNLGGTFLVELATCENAESGKAIEWPPKPLTVSGSFENLPPGRR